MHSLFCADKEIKREWSQNRFHNMFYRINFRNTI